MSKGTKKIVVLACTGMGKILASVGRAAEFKAHEKSPENFILGNLPGVAAGLKEDLSLLKGKTVITLTGCTENCPEKILGKLNIPIQYDIKIWEVFRENKGLAPDTRNDIGDKGRKLAEKIVEKIEALSK